MANYPVTLPTFTLPTATSPRNNPSHATAHINEMNEIVAIATELGTNPRGGSPTVAVRLNTIEAVAAAASTQAGVALTTATAGFVLAGVATSNAAVALATGSAGLALATIATSNAATALSTAQAAIPKAIGTTKGQIIVFTGSATPVVISASTDGTALVCDATSASGFKFAAPTASSVPSVSGSQYYSPKYSASTTLSWDSGNVQYIVLATGTQTFTFANPKDGGRYLLILKQTASGAAGTVVWPAEVLWPAAIAPVLTTSNGKTDVVAFVYDATNSKYYGGASLNY
jgi:hypothetical protein